MFIFLLEPSEYGRKVQNMTQVPNKSFTFFPWILYFIILNSIIITNDRGSQF